MLRLINSLWNDESGFVVSAELVLITTLAVMGLVVGLTEVSHALNNELEDVASAFGSLNQSYHSSGLRSCSKSSRAGSRFSDHADLCDSQFDIVPVSPQNEH